eukprot:5956081-Prymnesium_polylepis.2
MLSASPLAGASAGAAQVADSSSAAAAPDGAPASILFFRCGVDSLEPPSLPADLLRDRRRIDEHSGRSHATRVASPFT